MSKFFYGVWVTKFIQKVFVWDKSTPGTPDGFLEKILANFFSKMF